jgi:hypothetical protein
MHQLQVEQMLHQGAGAGHPTAHTKPHPTDHEKPNIAEVILVSTQRSAPCYSCHTRVCFSFRLDDFAS